MVKKKSQKVKRDKESKSKINVNKVSEIKCVMETLENNYNMRDLQFEKIVFEVQKQPQEEVIKKCIAVC